MVAAPAFLPAFERSNMASNAVEMVAFGLLLMYLGFQ